MANWTTPDCKLKKALQAPRLQFFIRMIPNGNNIVMQGSVEDSVKSVHKRIESRTGIPIQDQRLIHAGKQLQWEQSLGDCGIQNDATLQLVAHLRSGGASTMRNMAANTMFSLIWELSRGKAGSSTSSGVSDILERHTKMLFKLNALDSFMYTMAPGELVRLYRSESSSPDNKAMAEFTMRLYLDYCNSMFKKGLHVCCLPAVVGFCNILRIDARDDCDLYNSFMNSLRILLEECVSDLNPNQKVLLKGVFNHVGESVDLVFMDLDIRKMIPKLSLMSNFQNLIAFLVPLRDAIKVKGLQAWEARSRTGEEDKEEPSLANEIYHLHLMYSKLLYKMEVAFQDMDDYLDNKKQWHVWWVHYLTILKHMSKLSKLIDGAEEMLRGLLVHRRRSMSMLIILYTERGEDHEWILEYKSVLDFVARRRLAMMLFPSEEHEDEEMDAIYIDIDRPNLLAESFREILHERPEALRYGFSIYFLHEEGTGDSVTKEWFLLVCQEIFNLSNALFMACPKDRKRFFPNPASKVNPLHLEYFTFSGRIIALALMNEVQVGITFDRVFFKQLAGEHITLEDIQEADPYLYRSCKNILEMDADFVDSDALQLTFVREVEELGHRKVIELCPGGESLVVNSKNRQEYVDLLIHNQFVTSISEQVSHFAKGFGEIIFDSKIQQFFQILDLEDFDRMLYGEENAISVEDWKANTKYVGYGETDPQISWFWEVVRRMSTEERKILLFFWTSLKYLPFEGFGYLENLQICRTMEPDHYLPSSYTCAYQLCLPPYSSMAIMQDHFRTITTQEYVYCTFGID